MGYPLKNTIFNLCQGDTPKKFRRVAKVPYLPNPEHQKGVNTALFFHESTFTWGVALAQVGGPLGGGFKPPVVFFHFSPNVFFSFFAFRA